MDQETGSNVAMQSAVNGSTSLTTYIGSFEEVQTTGGGKRVAADVNGTFYYFGYDALGSQILVLDASGHIVGSQLFGPYGSSRYSTGTLPTSIGFTGQQNDAITGLDYYGARYYDPLANVFLSPDSHQGNAVGMEPYAYVGGNPETMTDPTGHNGISIGGFFSDVGGFFNNVENAVGGFVNSAKQWIAGPGEEAEATTGEGQYRSKEDYRQLYICQSIYYHSSGVVS